MSFIVECPQCKKEWIGKLNTSAYWDKEENKLCDPCKKINEEKIKEYNEIMMEARDFMKMSARKKV